MFDMYLYKTRLISILLTILFVTYTIVLMWFFVPHTEFEFYWRPDNQLVVKNVPEESLSAQYLKAGDKILEIDGKEVSRIANVFTYPAKDSYEFSVERDNKVLTFEIPFNKTTTPTSLEYRLPGTILTLAFLITALIIFKFGEESNFIATRVGYIFLFSSIAIIGLQGELISVPFAWLSRLVWFLAVFTTIYLGLIPNLRSITDKANRIFVWLFIPGIALGIGAFLEALILFPQQNSLDKMIGIGFYELSLLLSSLSWIVVLVFLVIRAYNKNAEKSAYERRQITIVLFFIALAIIPVTILTLIPRAALDIVFVPFPIAITLFVLIPACYFFVIYRRGYLGLDVIFSKTATFIILTITVLSVYGTALYFLSQQVAATVLPSTLLLIPALVVANVSNARVNSFLDKRLFNSALPTKSLPEYTTALSVNPELTTLKAIVISLAKDFTINSALLALKQEGGELEIIANINADVSTIPQFQAFDTPLNRGNLKQRTNALFQWEWVELLLPIIIRNEQVGFLALSLPGNAYFDSEQVLFLKRIADMLAVGSETISLFEASRKLSLRLLSAQEIERKNLATQIHDIPLQLLSFINFNISEVAANPSACTTEASQCLTEQRELLKSVMKELRQICAGLYPPVIEQGVDTVLIEVTNRFKELFSLDIVVKNEMQAHIGSSEISTVVYRILTESLNNIVKHAQTKTAEVVLKPADNSIVLIVKDNGVGSRLPSMLVSDLIRENHYGIRGMYEWAKLVNGEINLSRNQPTGTTVTLEIPINSSISHPLYQ